MLPVAQADRPPVRVYAQSFLNDLMNACIDVGMSLPDKGGMPQVGACGPAHPCAMANVHESWPCCA